MTGNVAHVGPAELLSPVAPDVRTSSQLGQYLRWLEQERGLSFESYADLHRWSVSDLPGFWSSVWDYFDVHAHAPYSTVLGDAAMPGAQWFPGAILNYAEHCLGGPADAELPAVLAYSQTRQPIQLTFGELADQVARARAGLRRMGVRRGDRVVGYLPNIPETLVAFLATASLGAVWATCAPEFGAASVIDRFAQIEPVVLITVSGYVYGDKPIDKRADVEALRQALPTVRRVVHVDYGSGELPDTTPWAELVAEHEELTFEGVPFDHPLYVLFSSGTTGKPKAIVHGHGGILVEHLKNGSLSWDLHRGDRVLWFTTTAWMMWNALVSALLVRASVILIDGNPLFPDLSWQWQLAEETRATVMGVSPGFLMACRREGISPARTFDLGSIRELCAAGSPLADEGYHWVKEQFGPGVLLNVGSGGTDVCTGIVQGSPWQPTWVGEISGPCLGFDVQAFNAAGEPVTDELGELVITRPTPSMPIGFWGDEDGSRYRAAYFDQFPGVWRHGDWIRIRPNGSCVIAGRSDATLNRGGVRLGTAEFYGVVEELDVVLDSLVVHLEDPAGGNGELILYVQLRPGAVLDDELSASIRRLIRTALSPRHVPDTIRSVPAIPRTRTGKKLEVPVKRILLGAAPSDVASMDVLADPRSLDAFVQDARDRQGEQR